MAFRSSADLWGTDKRTDAHEHLVIATTMFREMDMHCWREEAEMQIKEIGP
jgi:hypothetical protein